jgi:hypothetical protein
MPGVKISHVDARLARITKANRSFDLPSMTYRILKTTSSLFDGFFLLSGRASNSPIGAAWRAIV